VSMKALNLSKQSKKLTLTNKLLDFSTVSWYI
jgi:hypothetical protein